MSVDIVCFDFDSTLSKIEGIDELGRAANRLDEMVTLTNAAMNGEIALEAIYGKRLDLIKPDKARVDWLADRYISEKVEGVEEVFTTLLAQGKQVYIVSGGVRQAILPLAKLLNIPPANVHAVDMLFNSDGSYRGFDQQSPLARNGGKTIICKQIAGDGQSVAMVGDGNTDLEAKQAGAIMIGFGGVVQREVVEKNADFFVKSASLTAVLPYLIN